MVGLSTSPMADVFSGNSRPSLGDWGTGTCFLALFNVSQQPLTELLHLSCFPGVIEGHSYVIRAHTTGGISAPMTLRTGASTDATHLAIAVSVGVGEYEILSAFPVTSFAKSPVSVANLGLVRKMTGGAAVESTKIELRDNKTISISTELKALGVLGMLSLNP